jgi:hypothetical protein
MSGPAALYHFWYPAALAMARWVSSCQADELDGQMKKRIVASTAINSEIELLNI